MTLTDNEREFLSAVKDGDLKRIKSMARRGLISLENHDRIRDERSRTALIRATGRGHTNVIKLLIAKGANVNQQDKDGKTPLLYACRKYDVDLDVVKLLIANGANVNQQYKDGMTPLLYASRTGHANAMKLLIANGANANQQDKDGMTPLLYASREGHANGANVTLSLYPTTYNVDLDVVKLLIANGANVNQQDKDGMTPLLYASREYYVALMKLLIANGANVNQQDQDGKTPLLYALDRKYYWYVDMVKLLLDTGADPHKKDKNNRTALDSARYKGYDDVADAIERHIQRLQQQIQKLLRCNDRLPIAVWPNAISRLNSVNFIFPLLCEIPFLFKQTAEEEETKEETDRKPTFSASHHTS